MDNLLFKNNLQNFELENPTAIKINIEQVENLFLDDANTKSIKPYFCNDEDLGFVSCKSKRRSLKKLKKFVKHANNLYKDLQQEPQLLDHEKYEQEM